jgi:hypothetical protein
VADYFVNAASAGGDGTTNALSGASAAYASLSAAEAAEQGDLSSIGQTTFKCEGTTNDTTKVVLSGWTNASATNYIQVEASATGIHDGTADSGYVLAISSGHTIEVDVPYTRIGRAGFGIDIKSTSTGSSDEGIRFDLSAADLQTCYVVGNIIRSTTSTSSKDGVYCNPSGGTSSITLNAFANIIYGWNRGGIHAQNYSGTNTMLVNAIQNTCHGNGNGGGGTGDILGRDTAGGTTTIDSFNNICASAESFRDQSATNTIWTGSNNVTLDGEFNRGSMTGGSQATSGIAVASKTTGAWIVFTNITGGSEDYQLLDEAAGNLPVDYGADKTATVPNDALGNAYSTTPDNGAFEFQSAGGATISVPAGSMAVTGQVPTILATDDKSVAIPAGALLLTGFAPTAQAGSDADVAVPVGAMLLTGQAPVIINNVDTSIPLGTLTLTGFNPTIQAGGNVTTDIPVGSLDITGQEPTVSATDNKTAEIPTGTLSLTPFAPTVIVTDNKTVEIPAGTMTLTGFQPVADASDNKEVSIPAGNILLSGLSPVVAFGPFSTDVPVGMLTFTGFVPTIITVASPDSTTSVIGTIDQLGAAMRGTIRSSGVAVGGRIYDSVGVSGTITENALSTRGKIDDKGQSVKGTI